MTEPTREELIEILMDLIDTEAEYDPTNFLQITHGNDALHKAAFDLLERCGRLEYVDTKRYWARLVWPEGES